MQFKIKICGITSVEDACAAVDAGADALGLNFYHGSKRCIDHAVATGIAEQIDFRTDRVGVFVNESAEQIDAVCETARLHLIQLHGDEPPNLLGQLNHEHDVIRAVRFGAGGIRSVRKDWECWAMAGSFGPDAILVDAAASGQFGGTGNTVDWKLLAGYDAWLNDIPLILAGGLTPANVAEAIRIVRPHAVDVASGVESAPGKKDTAMMRDFVAAARAAFAEL
ncbi:MAG: phosphoribosylanthranilate isomerase [Pirellulales bacterium]